MQVVIPSIPKDVVEYLDHLFPERSPDPKWSDREIWLAVGRREVVRMLRAYLEKQKN